MSTRALCGEKQFNSKLGEKRHFLNMKRGKYIIMNKNEIKKKQ